MRAFLCWLGAIGAGAFRLLLKDERLRRVPWLLEVPGTDRSGPNLDQINLLRDCAGLSAAGRRGLAPV